VQPLAQGAPRTITWNADGSRQRRVRVPPRRRLLSDVDAFGYILHPGIGQGGTAEATSHQNYLAIGTVTIIVGNPEYAVDDSSATIVNEPQTTAEPGSSTVTPSAPTLSGP
jgi:hypothetical protein